MARIVVLGIVTSGFSSALADILAGRPFPARLLTILAATVISARCLIEVLFHGIGVNDHTASLTLGTHGGECLQQAGAQALTGHLHQAQGSNFTDLVSGAVTAKVLGQPPQNEVRFSSRTMSMKSTTIMPPKSRRRI